MTHDRILDRLWLTLMLLTLGSAWLAESAETGLLVTLAIALVVSFKGLMIVDHFMELRHANVVLRRLMRIYFYVIPSLIVLVYLFPRQIANLTSLS
ncbi:MAG TPA: thiosulfate reductase [Sedimenticola thiotaurini]|uniref:Thiosulfate reductase n=1 Tax=Sedimenticola thiotaurini TaxID=1543721 RepID=A0A831W795_9GAMM|nr:thiosulfate reductase [Sedimenticola thiotaurini]